MPLPVINNTYRVALEWQNADWPAWRATNVIHFRKGGTTSGALWTALDANVTAAMWAHTSDHAHIQQVNITPLDGSTVTLPEVTGSPAKWSGSQSAYDYIPQVSALLKCVTGKRGRSYRGRVFLPWMLEQTQTAGVYNNATRAAAETAWRAFLVAMTGAGFEFVIASYKLQTAEAVLSVFMEQDTATIRRRWARVSL